MNDRYEQNQRVLHEMALQMTLEVQFKKSDQYFNRIVADERVFE